MRQRRRSQRPAQHRYAYRKVCRAISNGRPRYLVDLANVPDLTELDLPPTMKTHFPDPADLLNFTLTITPDEGLETCVLSSSDVYL